MTTKTNIEAVNSGQTEREADRDAVTREQIEAWAKLAGIEHFTEKGLERLGDFAIFARQARAASSATATSDALANARNAVTLTGAQLLEALDFIAPDRDSDQLETEATIQYGTGHSGDGIYCWITEYPEEGAILLDGTTAIAAQSPAPASPSGEDAAEKAAAPMAASPQAPAVIEQWQFRVKDVGSPMWTNITHSDANELKDNPAFELRALSLVPPQAPAVDGAEAVADDARRMRTLCRLLDAMDDMGNGFPGEIHAAFQDGSKKVRAALDAASTPDDATPLTREAATVPLTERQIVAAWVTRFNYVEDRNAPNAEQIGFYRALLAASSAAPMAEPEGYPFVAGLTAREQFIRNQGYRQGLEAANEITSAEFKWPPLPAFPKPFLNSEKSGAIFTEHQMQAYANAYGELVRAAASAQASAFDGDSEVTRKAFREYDAEYPVSHRSHWQIWRDAIAYAVKSGIATPPSPNAHTIGEDAANVAIGEREAALMCERLRSMGLNTCNEAAALIECLARAALTAEKVAGQEPVGFRTRMPGFSWVPWLTDDQATIQKAIKDAHDHGSEGEALYAAPQQPAQPVAQTLALTDEQREAIEYAVRWMDENVSNRYAHTAAKELRALLAAQPTSSLAEGDKQ